MARKIKITSDSTCDVSKELCDAHNIGIAPLHVVYGSESYDDMQNIVPEDILRRYKEKKELPKTSAVSIYEYVHFFRKYVDDGYEVVHINLGSSISSSHQNAVAAAEEVGGVYVIDSQSLSCGMALLVLKAVDYVEKTDLSAKEIAEKIEGLIPKIRMSFVVDDLEFLRAGGRCSTLAMLGANLLSIKPCIEVDNTKGSAMTVGRKYRGKLDKVVAQYTREKLSQYTNFDGDRAYIISCDVPEEIVNNMYEIVDSLGVFKEIIAGSAGCTISSHCGSGTIGIGFLVK